MTEFHEAKGDKSPYVCGEPDCGQPVFLLPNGKIYKPCGHDSAPVLANMEAVVYGKSVTTL